MFLGVDKITGEEVAIKKITDCFHSTVLTYRLIREISILKKIPPHPCIVSLKKVIDPTNDPQNFKSLLLIFEKMTADLQKLIRSQNFVT